jgi:hypothetical protein
MNPKGRFPARELNRFTLPVGAVCGNGQPLRPFSTFLALYGLQNALARVCTKAGNRQSPAPRNNRSTPHRQLLQAKVLARQRETTSTGNWELKTVFSFARKIRIVRWCAYSLRCAYHDFQFHDFPCCD